MSELVYLRTDTFVLRTLNNSDKNDLSVIFNDYESQKYLPGLTLAYECGFEQIIILSNLNQSLFLVIEDISTKKVIGFIYTYINNLTSSIHYALSPAYRKKGIMVEALKLLIKYLYNKKLVNTITFRINIFNRSSLAIMKKMNISISHTSDEEYIFQLQLIEKLPF